MTQTRSAILRTMPRSWVMNRIAMPRRDCRSLRSWRICACTVTSSAVVGSSAIKRSGSLASAIAIITRWRWPPESWCGIALQPGFRLGDSAQGEQLEDPRPRRLAGDAAVQQQDFAELLFDGVKRIERRHRLLEHDGDVAAAVTPDLPFGETHQVLALEHDGAGRMRRRRIGQQFHDRQCGGRLAGAGLADQRERLALADFEGYPIDCQHLAVAMAE